MTGFLPIFPLNIVVYPGEALNLRIFEPRYKQLVLECLEQDKDFGIPAVLNGTIQELGTKVKILSIDKTYDDGQMDIKTQGVSTFRILEIIEDVPDKLYQGAIISSIETEYYDGRKSKMDVLLKEIAFFHSLLNIKKDYKIPMEELTAYHLAHHLGLNLEQEYDILRMPKESQRQEYLLRHLRDLLPTVQELKNLEERIKLNGHYKRLSLNN
jgi:Lon protease-like protein